MLARQYEQMGDIARAERTLNALCVLLAGDPEQQKLYNLANAMLDELRENQAGQPDRYALVEAALKRADTLSAADRTDEAQKIWAAIVELYSVDRNAREYVEQAQTRLKEGIPPGP